MENVSPFKASLKMLQFAKNMSKSHVRDISKTLHDLRSRYFCGYVTNKANRELNNKIITNSVHVRIEKWFAKRKLSRSEMENLTFLSTPQTDNSVIKIIKCVI